jgi:hypothetical protein
LSSWRTFKRFLHRKEFASLLRPLRVFDREGHHLSGHYSAVLQGLQRKFKADTVAARYSNRYKEQLTEYFTMLNRESTGNNYPVIGTLDRSEWKHGMQDKLSLRDEQAKEGQFNDYNKLD